jgi:hypothetical protein
MCPSVLQFWKTTLQRGVALTRFPAMSKKFLPLLFAPLLFVGCTSTFTNLTPLQQSRNANNLYPVEVSMDSRQQSLRWDSIRPQIVVGNDYYPMHSTRLMTNRWEGLVPVPPSENSVRYRYKFDFDYNAFGGPRPDSAISPEYTLKITEQ